MRAGGGGAGEAQRRQPEAGDAEDREVVARVEEDRRSPAAPTPSPPISTVVSLSPGDDVGVGQHLIAARSPSPSPRSRGRTRCRRRGRRCGARRESAGVVRRRAAAGCRPACRRRRCSGSGSIRASALSTTPEGGISSSRRRRIAERSTSIRSASVPGSETTITPSTHATPSATAALRAAPAIPSMSPRNGHAQATAQPRSEAVHADRQDRAGGHRARAGRTPARRARRSRRQQRVGDAGADRSPRRRSRASDSAPTMKPRRKPLTANSSVAATISQSSVVIAPPSVLALEGAVRTSRRLPACAANRRGRPGAAPLVDRRWRRDRHPDTLPEWRTAAAWSLSRSPARAAAGAGRSASSSLAIVVAAAAAAIVLAPHAGRRRSRPRAHARRARRPGLGATGATPQMYGALAPPRRRATAAVGGRLRRPRARRRGDRDARLGPGAGTRRRSPAAAALPTSVADSPAHAALRHAPRALTLTIAGTAGRPARALERHGWPSPACIRASRCAGSASAPRRGHPAHARRRPAERRALGARPDRQVGDGQRRRSSQALEAAGLPGVHRRRPRRPRAALRARACAASPGGTLYAGDRVLARAAAARGPRRPHLDLPDAAGVGRERDRRQRRLRREHRRDGAGQRRAARRGGPAAHRAPAARLDLQDHHPDRRARGPPRAGRRTVFPYATSTTIDNTVLHNSNGEDCGGTLANAFAVSCNSVFVPLGVRLGAPRLLARGTDLRLQRPLADLLRRREHDPGRQPERRLRRRLERDRPGAGARDAAADAARGRHHRPRRAPPGADLRARPAPPLSARDPGLGRAHGAGADGRRRALRHRRPPRRSPASPWPARPAPRRSSVPGCAGATGADAGRRARPGPRAPAAPRGATGRHGLPARLDDDRGRRLVRRLRARRSTPASRSRCCCPYQGAGGTAAAPVAAPILEEGLALTR